MAGTGRWRRSPAQWRRGPHQTALEPDAIDQIWNEAHEKQEQGFARIVLWDDIKDRINDYPQLKVSPLSMIPHKSRKYRAILDLSFKLRIAGMALPSVNEATIKTAVQEAMNQLGTVLPRIIEAVANAPEEDGDILFAKLDIKDGFWRMVVPEGAEWNFAYVLPQKPGEPIRLVIPSALQMGWCESPPFFCSASETARDIAQVSLDTGAEPRTTPIGGMDGPTQQVARGHLGTVMREFSLHAGVIRR